MEPARAFLDKNLLPINVSGPQLRDGGVTTIRTTKRSAYSVTTFSKIQAIADFAAHAIVLDPPDMRLIDPTLQNQIFDEASDRIIGKCGNNGGLLSETTPQSARDV